MISLMALNGLRRSEVAGIKISDINGCHITVLSKGASRDTIRLNDEMCQMFQKYLNEERETDSEYLFYSTRGGVTEGGSLRGETINNRVKTAGRKSGMSEERLGKLSAHALRHCFITNIVRTSGIYQASRAARHSNPNITRLVYDHTGSEIAHQAVMNQRKLNIMSVAGE
jgi:integrase